MFKKIGLVFSLLLLPAALLAQNPESAVGGGASIWAGAEGSSFNPDYSCHSNSPFSCGNQLVGPGAFFDFNLHPRWGIEGEARWLHWNGIGSQVESNYLGGGRYRLKRFHRVDIWGKLLVGGGWITTPNYPQVGSLKGSYFVYAPGATLDYRLTHRLSLRGDYEYQIWPSFAGPPTYNTSTGALIEHNSGLTPNGFSVGIAYRILGQ